MATRAQACNNQVNNTAIRERTQTLKVPYFYLVLHVLNRCLSSCTDTQAKQLTLQQARQDGAQALMTD